MKNKKIRLNAAILEEVFQSLTHYSAVSSKTITLTPIIYKLGFSGINKSKYLKRIIVRFPEEHVCYAKLRGTAPLHKVFTVEDFIRCFYAIKDKKGNYCFKYYSK